MPASPSPSLFRRTVSPIRRWAYPSHGPWASLAGCDGDAVRSNATPAAGAQEGVGVGAATQQCLLTAGETSEGEGEREGGKGEEGEGEREGGRGGEREREIAWTPACPWLRLLASLTPRDWLRGPGCVR